METETKQALRFAENLTLPTVQVIVISANMGCTHCQQRVSQVISKMNGLVEYVVDVRNKQVIVTGAFHSKKTQLLMLLNSPNNTKKRFSFSFFSSIFGPTCFRAEVSS
ncbi:hypothetical protein HHK36_027977 [Tetracentron sinense]|uniref:HMA domain-containing protein n=1 Tax=Tetracentron sinense TaxID=13715 RepID=A0A834YK64_TETSI|nr:hypothetical protein HHK36_027977 [Tetracentron sinense]